MKSKIRGRGMKFACIVLAFAVLFSSVSILLCEVANTGVAVAETAEGAQATSESTNDLTSDSNKVYMPNYDTEVITKTFSKPTVATFGQHDASYYPSYTNKLDSADFDDVKKTAILTENQKMLDDVKEWYEAGTLRQNLKKHVSADGQFSNANGSYNSAPRVEKVISINNQATPRKRSLGVFAPGGEVLTITIDESLVGKLTVNIGYPYSASDLGSGKFNRWPNDRMAQFFLSFKLNDTVNYIGSPLGGMVTLDGVSANLGDFDITVSGGVDMPDYKLGVSTKEDWQNILAAPAPYVWLLTPYQYFVMPKAEIADIDDPYNALLWWHKASMISMYGMAREDTAHFYTPVISIYDSYVFIGEAVATVWAFYTNAPSYWCHGVLDYDNLMYGGSWGALHEYNHHHQSHAYNDTEWGVGGHDEITNNVLNAISYILLTDIALARSENSTLKGWAAVSDPYTNYQRLASKSENVSDYESFDTDKLFGFADIMHTFGAENFLEYLRAMYGYGDAVDGYKGTNLTEDNYLTTQDGFTLFASLFFKTDFTDYFRNVWHFKISAKVVNQIKRHNFDKFFSLTNLYSAGVKGVETGRAYQIKAGEATLLKFDEFTATSGKSFQLVKVSEPEHGTLTDNKDGTFSYLPDSDFAEDSIDLTYKVKVGGKSYKRTLVVKLIADTVVTAERAAGTKTYSTYVDLRNLYLNKWYRDAAMGHDFNVYSSRESLFSYDNISNWTTVSGNYINGTAKHTDSGKVSFYVTGTDLVLYSTNAESTITIDGTTYTIDANDNERSPSFTIDGLTDTQHLVVIEGKDMTFDMIKISAVPWTRATLPNAVVRSSYVNWGGMSVVIVIGVGFIGVLTAFVVINVKQKKSKA